MCVCCVIARAHGETGKGLTEQKEELQCHSLWYIMYVQYVCVSQPNGIHMCRLYDSIDPFVFCYKALNPLTPCTFPTRLLLLQKEYKSLSYR